MQLETLVQLSVIAAFLLVSFFALKSLADSLNILFLKHSMLKFRKDLVSSLSRNDISWPQVQILAKCYELKSAQIRTSIELLISESLTGKDERLADQIDTLEYYLDQHKIDAPFEDLPTEVRLQLTRLREILMETENAYLLDPLAEHLRRFNTENIRERTKQKRLSFASVAIGIIGLLIALISIAPPGTILPK